MNISTAALCVVLLFSRCGSPPSQSEVDAEYAREDRAQAVRDSVIDFREFKADSEARIVKNSRLIADFKVRIMTGEKSMKNRYQKRLNDLEAKNNTLRTKLEQYSETGSENWVAFKSEWEQDMDRVVKSLNEMTGNNTAL